MKLDNHHIRAYIFFLLLSIALVATLFYLYTPSTQLRSESVISAEASIDLTDPKDQISMSQEVSEDAKVARRIRLTSMLLKHQLQLKELESAGVQNNEKIEEVSQLRIKIENLESMIKKLSH